MSKRESILRYGVIINKLRKNAATFNEIAQSLAYESELSGYNLHVSKRTFQRDLDDIRSIYNIDIQFDFSRKVYFIDYAEKPELGERVLEAFDTINALNINRNFTDCIQFEKRQPSGTENLHLFLHAIKNNFQIEFIHKKYWDKNPTQRLIEPYILKEFKNRWYIVGREIKSNKIKSFGIDRIKGLNIVKKKFSIPENINMDAYFKHCFGIIGPNSNEPNEVILSFTAQQGKFIKALPMHESQIIIIDNEKELQIKLNLYITHDFVMELLSHGDRVKIIKPSGLIADIKTIYQKTLDRYR